MALLAVSLAGATQAEQKYGPDDPVPPGATADVRPLSGTITQIRGLAAAVSGSAQALAGALQDLGAKVTEQEIRIELAADVLFDFDKADLRPVAIPALHKVAAVINGYPSLPVQIDGHTDSKGADDYNMRLSERRASSVKGWLARDGRVDAARMAATGRGETQPVAPNAKPDGSDDPEGRQKNRRVEITIRKR